MGENWSVLTFSFVTTIFLFVVANAWADVLPIFDPIKLSAEDASGEAVPLLLGAGTDVNMPLALALVAGTFVEMHAFLTRGVSYFKQLFPVRFFRRRIWEGVLYTYLVLVHDLTRAARLLSFTFRLFGALTAAELLRVMIAFLTPIVLVVPFYGLEMLLGLLQAIVFAGHRLGAQALLHCRPCGRRRNIAPEFHHPPGRHRQRKAGAPGPSPRRHRNVLSGPPITLLAEVSPLLLRGCACYICCVGL